MHFERSQTITSYEKTALICYARNQAPNDASSLYVPSHNQNGPTGLALHRIDLVLQNGKQMPSPIFKQVADGWVFRAPNAWVFGRAEHHLLNDAQRAAIQAIVTPHRPVLVVVAVILALACAVGVAIATAMLVSNDADNLTFAGLLAMIIAVLLLLYVCDRCWPMCP